MPGAEKLLAELRAIGDRRVDLVLAQEKLATDTAQVVHKARKAKLSMTLVANLVGLDRTWLYRGFGA